MNPDLWLLQTVLLWKQEGRESIGENKACKFVCDILVFNMLEIPCIHKALDLWNYVFELKNQLYYTTRCPSTIRLKLEFFAWLKEQKLKKIQFLFGSDLPKSVVKAA